MADLKRLAQSIMIWGRQAQEDDDYIQTIRTIIVELLRHAYCSAKKVDRKDVLVPELEGSVSKKPIMEIRDVRTNGLIGYQIKYNWPESPHEFCDGYTENCSIPQGTILDRIGSIDGLYLCPIFGEIPFSASERALPYLLSEKTISDEPSYHVYRAKKNISKKTIKEALDVDTKMDTSLREYCKKLVGGDRHDNDVAYGRVASVDAFGRQGKGGGMQYRTCVPVKVLLHLGLLEKIGEE